MSYFKQISVENVNGIKINPATEEKQDAIITAIGGIGGSDPVGLKNVASATINPATEDGNLATINTNTSDVATQTTLALMKTALDAVKAQTDKLTYTGDDYLEVNDNAGGGGLTDIYAELNNVLRQFIFDSKNNLRIRVMNESSSPLPVSADTITTLTNQTSRGHMSMNFINHLDNRRTAYQAANT